MKVFFGKLVAIALALSFSATLVQISSASSDKTNTMACCVGKAGHCDSGISAKKVPPPPPEPMCGLDNTELDLDSITIVAEPSHKESHDSLSRNAEKTSHAAESNSLSKPCRMECGACASSLTRHQKRERGVLQPTTYHNPTVTVHSRFESQPFSFSSNEDWKQTSPRGPPADLL